MMEPIAPRTVVQMDTEKRLRSALSRECMRVHSADELFCSSRCGYGMKQPLRRKMVQCSMANWARSAA
jgi:hypothetical protein